MSGAMRRQLKKALPGAALNYRGAVCLADRSNGRGDGFGGRDIEAVTRSASAGRLDRGKRRRGIVQVEIGGGDRGAFGGEPLDPARSYTVASSAFLANGGDGYSMLGAGRVVRRSPERMADSFLEFFRSRDEVAVPAVGRQRDLAREP